MEQDDQGNHFNVRDLDESTWRILIWQELRAIRSKQDITNGRISRLETFRWMSVGAIAVISAIVVPLFLQVVADTK